MIIKGDIPKVKEIMQAALGTDEYVAIARMGGLTNHTYKVTLASGKEYVVRIPGEGTEEIIARSDEEISTRLACKLDIDAELVYFGKDGAKVSAFIEEAETMSNKTLVKADKIAKVVEIFRKLHACGEDTGVPFEVFDMAASYEKSIEGNKVAMFDDYAEIKAAVMQIKKEMDAALGEIKVPCHNDPLCENWVMGKDKMYLIDWEYAGMNDGMWDLAAVSIEASFDEKCDELLLSGYLGREPLLLDYKHFLASKIYVDYLWTLWAKARAAYDGQAMEDWATERYTRLKGFLQAYRALN